MEVISGGTPLLEKESANGTYTRFTNAYHDC